MNMFNRLIKAITFFKIEIIIILICQFIFVLFPDGHHAVNGLFFSIIFVFILAALFQPAAVYVHFNRVANKIRVFFYNASQAIFLQIFIKIFFFGVLFDSQDDIRTNQVLLTWLNSIPVNAVGFPAICFIAAKGFTDDRNLISNHKGGIKTYSKLANDIIAIF